MTEVFISAVVTAFEKGALKKLVFSRPMTDAPAKISARLCAHRGQKILAAEYSLPGNTVSQKNFRADGIEAFLKDELPRYGQINLLTELGDAELKVGKKGTVALGLDKLMRKFQANDSGFEAVFEALDNKKNYMLKGDEPFLIALGISDKSGRVHDKKQAKFRQINKFLEYTDELYAELPEAGELLIYDLCCGKSYLSFAVYHYFTVIKKRKLRMLGIDLKRDVIDFCAAKASELGYTGLTFITDDITNTPKDKVPDMVISLHACDIATDIVLDTAIKLGARAILSTPCCHRELSTKINAKELSFVTAYPKLKRTLCDALTDALRLKRLEALGYEASATELVDPEDTPKNTLIRAIKRNNGTRAKKNEYEALLSFLLGEGAGDYIGRL